MRSLLSTPSLRRFFLAHGQSQLGTGAAYVALVLVGYERMHSGWGVALLLLADFVPGIVLSVPFGALADRVARRDLAVAADMLRATAFVALALVPSFAATLALALLAGVGTAAFGPAVSAALPGLVAPEQRSQATALYGGLINAGITAGPALTAVLLLAASPSLVLLINGVTFAVSAALLSTVGLGRGSEHAAEGSVLASAAAGARAALRIPGLAALLSISTMIVLASAMMNVAEPLLATGPLAVGNAGYSLLVTVYGVGLVSGSVVNARAGSEVGPLRVRWLSGIALTGLGMLGSAAAPSLAWAIASFAFTGFGNTFVLGPEFRLLQEIVREGLRGRVFGLRDMLTNVAFVVAFVSAGALLSGFGVRAVFALGGAVLVGLAAVGALTFHPHSGEAAVR
jgi:MFS family permease